MATTLAVAFALADVALLVTLLVLRLRVAASLVAVAVLADLLGLAAKQLGPQHDVIGELASTLAFTELPVAVGIMLLVRGGLGAFAPARPVAGRSFFAIAIVVVAVLAGLARFAKLVAGRSPLPLTFAWASWLVHLAGPLLLAAYALVVARAFAGGAPVANAPQDPYRAPAPGPPPEPPRPLLDPVRAVAAQRELARTRSVLTARLCAAIATSVVAFVAAFADVSGGTGVLLVALEPMVSLVMDVLLMVTLLRLQGSLAPFARVSGRVVVAALLLLPAALSDLVALGGLLRAHGAGRYAETVFGAWVPAAMAGFLALVLLTSALGRVGENVGSRSCTTLAGTVRALFVMTATLLVTALLALVSARHDAGGVIGISFVGVAAVVGVVAIVQVLRLLGATRAALQHTTQG